MCFLSLLLFFIHVSVSPVLVLFISPSVMGVCCLVVRPHRPATPPPDRRWRRRVSGALSNCIIVKCSCNFHNTCTALRLPAHTTEGPTAASSLLEVVLCECLSSSARLTPGTGRFLEQRMQSAPRCQADTHVLCMPSVLHIQSKRAVCCN